MKAILYSPSKGACLSEIPVPAISPEEALISVAACGVCGTDLMKLSQRPPKAILGHEVAGTIAQLGRKVLGF